MRRGLDRLVGLIQPLNDETAAAIEFDHWRQPASRQIRTWRRLRRFTVAQTTTLPGLLESELNSSAIALDLDTLNIAVSDFALFGGDCGRQ
jgi:hypothetical protein